MEVVYKRCNMIEHQKIFPTNLFLIDEWKECDNIEYITQKEMVKSLDKTTKR